MNGTVDPEPGVGPDISWAWNELREDPPEEFIGVPVVSVVLKKEFRIA